MDPGEHRQTRAGCAIHLRLGQTERFSRDVFDFTRVTSHTACRFVIGSKPTTFMPLPPASASLTQCGG
jgi:hypothetical protein